MPYYKNGISKCLLCKQRHIDDVFKFGHDKITNGKQKIYCTICNIYVQCEYLNNHKQKFRHLKNEQFNKCFSKRPSKHVTIKQTKNKKIVQKCKRPKCLFNNEGNIILKLY